MTYNWYWLVDLMMEEGYQVHLANLSRVQQYSGLKHGDDEDYAFWLAEMLRLKILPEGFIYPREHRPLRDLLRKRGHLGVTPLLTGNDDLSLAGRVSKEAIDSLTRQITAIEVAVEKKMNLKRPYDLLLSMPGVGRILALTIMMRRVLLIVLQMWATTRRIAEKCPPHGRATIKRRGRAIRRTATSISRGHIPRHQNSHAGLTIMRGHILIAKGGERTLR